MTPLLCNRRQETKPDKAEKEDDEPREKRKDQSKAKSSPKERKERETERQKREEREKEERREKEKKGKERRKRKRMKKQKGRVTCRMSGQFFALFVHFSPQKSDKHWVNMILKRRKDWKNTHVVYIGMTKVQIKCHLSCCFCCSLGE